MSTFALVHAAWHGSWCWDRLAAELEARGHASVAPDLPSDDVSAGCVRYAQVVIDALAHVKDEVVIVGHSLGGLTAPLVKAERVKHLVYICALLPLPGRSWQEQFFDEPSMVATGFGRGIATDDLGRTFWADQRAAVESMYGDCAEPEIDFALARLRPQARAPYEEICPLTDLPEVPTTYIAASADRVVSPDWGSQAAVERFQAQVVQLPGSHSPFLSRPAALASILDQIVTP